MRGFRQPETVKKDGGEHLTARRVSAALLTGALALLPSVPAEAHGRHGGNKSSCREYVLPVSLDPGGPKDQRVDVTQCDPKRRGHHGRDAGRGHGKGKIVVGTPGATYTKAYFDWPQNPDRYSYARAAAEDGLSVLTYTPVGRVTGKSSYPHSSELTLDRNVHVLRQVIDSVVRQGYEKIYSKGHSMGAGVAKAHAATDTRVDGLILTGYKHGPRNLGFGTKYIHPANQDPAFKKFDLDDGYGTTRPGLRGAAFYGSAASRQVIRYDGAHKDVVSFTFLNEYTAAREASPQTNASSRVRQPVLEVVGVEDEIFCTPNTGSDCGDRRAVTAMEREYFPNAESLTYEPIAFTGHDLSTATTAPYTAGLINDWVWRQ